MPLGRSWALLGASWAPLGRLLDVSGPSLGPLGRFLSDFWGSGRVWGGFGEGFGKVWVDFWKGLGKRLGWFWKGSWEGFAGGWGSTKTCCYSLSILGCFKIHFGASYLQISSHMSKATCPSKAGGMCVAQGI